MSKNVNQTGKNKRCYDSAAKIHYRFWKLNANHKTNA